MLLQLQTIKREKCKRMKRKEISDKRRERVNSKKGKGEEERVYKEVIYVCMYDMYILKTSLVVYFIFSCSSNSSCRIIMILQGTNQYHFKVSNITTQMGDVDMDFLFLNTKISCMSVRYSLYLFFTRTYIYKYTCICFAIVHKPYLIDQYLYFQIQFALFPLNFNFILR